MERPVLNERSQVELERTLRTRWPGYRSADFVRHSDEVWSVALEDAEGVWYAFRMNLGLSGTWTLIPIHVP